MNGFKNELMNCCDPVQRGSAMIEFAVVAPIITLLGLALLQYAMLFFAKNQINHAGFMAVLAMHLATLSVATTARFAHLIVVRRSVRA
jgi:Flp pilus assembly protein TadG